MMKHEWINKIEDFFAISKEWDQALADSGSDNPFIISDFVISWWKYHKRNKELAIFIIRDNGRIIAGIPLCIYSRYLNNIITHVGGCNANLTHFFSNSLAINPVDSLIIGLNDIKKWDILMLDRVLSGNRLIDDCRNSVAMSEAGLKCRISDAGFDGVIDLDEGYDSIIKNLPKRLNQYLRNSKKEISLLGELALNRVSGSDEVNKLFNEYRALSLRAFRDRDAVSAFEDEACSNFYEELLGILDSKKMLDAHRLTAGTQTLAISFGYRFGKGFKWILTTYNPDYQDLRPGHHLIDSLIKEAILNGDPYFDMYYGGEVFYKRQWCNKMVPLKKILIYRKNICNEFVLWAERALRSNTSFMAWAKKTRASIKKTVSQR